MPADADDEDGPWATSGQSVPFLGRHVHQSFKPWLVYTNGKWPSRLVDWHEDVTKPSTMRKGSFRWQQDGAPAAYLIEKLTVETALVVDPMAGTGAYGGAALSLGREFIGIEADKERFASRSERSRRPNDPRAEPTRHENLGG